jgi:uncharacterized protein HemX
MSTPPENKSAVPSIDTSVLAEPRPAERFVRHLKRAGSIFFLLLFALLMLALVLAIPVGYYWIKYQATHGQVSQSISQLIAVTRSI